MRAPVGPRVLGRGRRAGERGRPRDATARQAAAVRREGGEARQALVVRAAPRQPRRDPARADRRAAARVPGAVGDALRALRDRALPRHDRRGDPVGGAQVGLPAGPAARGRDRRVVVADEHGRRRRRLVRALPGPAALPLRRAGVRAVPRRRRVQRRLLRRDPALLLRRPPDVAEHRGGRERQALPQGAISGARSARGSPGAGGTSPARGYVREVKRRLRERTWRTRDFRAG